MKKIIAVVALCLHSIGLFAGINFGSPQSALEANGGSITFSPTSSVTLTNGTLRDTGSAGNIGNANGKSMTCSGMTIETKEGTVTQSMKTDGTLDTDAETLVLGDNKVLTVQGGTVAQAVTVNGTEGSAPSIIQGYGGFGDVVTVADDGELVMRWQGNMNQSIDLNSAGTNNSILKLENDLTFAPGKTITAAGNDGTKDITQYNGSSITFNGATIGQVQQWDTAKLNLNGSLTINANTTLATSAAVINAQGNDIAGSASFLGSVGGTIVNGKVTSASVLGGTGAWVLDNTIINHSSSAIRVVEGTLTENNASNIADPFGDAVTWTSANIELLQAATLSDTWTVGTGSEIHGLGNKMNLSSGALKASTSGATIELVNIYLDSLADSSLQSSATDDTAATWDLTNVTLDDGTSAVRVAQGTFLNTDNTTATGSANANPFGIATTWGASTLELLKNTSPSAVWTLTTGSALHGNGKKLEVSNGLYAAAHSASFSLSNVYLDGMSSNSLKSAAGAGESTWSLTNVTLDTGTEALRVLEGDLKNTANDTSLDTDPFTAAVTWTAANMELLRDTSPSGAWTIATSFSLNGNGHKFDTAGVTLPASTTGTLRNVTIDNADSSSLAGTSGSSVWNLHNTIVQDSNADKNEIVLNGTLTSDTIDLFGTSGATLGASRIELNKDLTVAGKWVIGGATTIDGKGNTITMTDTTGVIDLDATLTLNDVTFINVTNDSFDKNSHAVSMRMNNVGWYDAGLAGAVRISATPHVANQKYATVALEDGASGTDGLLFATEISFSDGAHVDLFCQ